MGKKQAEATTKRMTFHCPLEKLDKFHEMREYYSMKQNSTFIGYAVNRFEKDIYNKENK